MNAIRLTGWYMYNVLLLIVAMTGLLIGFMASPRITIKEIMGDVR